MKGVIVLVVLVAGSLVATYFGSTYVLGGIEAGMPGGGHGKFSDYHEGNLITEFFGSDESGCGPADFDPGEVDTNPFVK
jgi:hypothetical protein